MIYRSSTPLSSSSRLTILALLSATTFYCFYKSLRLRSSKHKLSCKNLSPSLSSGNPKVLYVSQTGTSKTLAHRLHAFFISQNLVFDLLNVKDYEPEDLAKETLILIVASTWEDGKPPPNAHFFANWMDDSVDDFRVGSLLLSKCKFAVFGIGSRAYGESFNAVARGFSRRLKGLGAKEVLPLHEGDVDGGELDAEFDAWGQKLVSVLRGVLAAENGVSVGGQSDFEDVEVSDDKDEGDSVGDSDVVDLEDIAGKTPSRNSRKAFVVNGAKNGEKEMVTSIIRANLEKLVIL